MKFFAFALITGCVAFGAQAPAQALDPAAPQHAAKRPRDPKKAFARLDADADGKISLDEFKAHGKNAAKREKRFQKLDANHDGYLSMEEFAAGPRP